MNTQNNWKPDIIIYYFLSKDPEWTKIKIPDFNTSYTDIKRYMIFEDHHYYDKAIDLYKKYNFKKLLKPTKHALTESKYKQNNVDFSVIGFYIDPNIFKVRNTNYKYDLLLYGFINSEYPLRKKMLDVLTFLQKKKNIRIKIIPHHGYSANSKEKIPRNEDLSKIINESRFTLACSSSYELLLKKYYEIPMSGSTIIGDIPPDYMNLLKDKIIHVDKNTSNEQIINIIMKALNNNYLNIENNSKKWGIELGKSQSFEQGYNTICNIIKNINNNIFIHDTACVDEGANIGENTKIWHYSHICKGAQIGKNCNIGQNVFIADGVILGDNCKVQNNVSIYKGVIAKNNVFFGPSCVLTNDINPRCAYPKNGEYMKTILNEGVTLGANSTIVCGNTIGENALIGAGAVVCKDVEANSIIVGNPGKNIGVINKKGIRTIIKK